ncbi:MAG: tRNA epoxyqueuosine(34) reductase QueG [Herpetosiphon sp.]
MESTSLVQEIEEQAVGLGFDLFGVARAVEPPHADALRPWIEAGHAGELQYLARNAARRMDPQLVVEGARVIISVGMQYRVREPDPTLWNDPARGRIARYAWGLDYHDVLLPRLRELQGWIEARGLPSQLGRSYVDTGPMLERSVGVAAGIGFQGKNTMLINARQGSWFVIGEIVLAMDVQASAAPPQPGCGRCQRCIVACPTQAFVGPYVLDARRCISYLTIELKGAIPRELRPMIGNHIFGCDVCQEVCPWNVRFGQFARQPAFEPPVDAMVPRLLDLLALDDSGFRTRFKGSPIKRAKRRGLLRNVAIALGNWGSYDAVGGLNNALHDHESLIRGHAAWALGRIGSLDARDALQQRLALEADEWVYDEITAALTEWPGPSGAMQRV